MIHIALCDDCQEALASLQKILDRYKLIKNVDCSYTAYTNGLELIAAIESGKRYDAYFLDILMPSFTGIETAKELRRFDKMAPLIFLTASPEFALEGYAVKAFHYLLKPVDETLLFQTLDDLVELLKTKKNEKAIIVKSHDGLQKIRIDNITYVEVIGRNLLYHLYSGRVVSCNEAFSSACSQLLEFGCFVKTHRSFMVNMQFIETIETNQVTLQTLSVIPIAQGKVKEIRQHYLAYQMQED